MVFLAETVGFFMEPVRFAVGGCLAAGALPIAESRS